MSTAKKVAGSLNRRITIQASTQTPDGQGGNTEAWLDAIYLWAEVLPGSSNRQFDIRQTRIQSDVRFRIRMGTLINKNNRILYLGRVCVIEGIRDDDYFREFQIVSCRYDDKSTGTSGTGGGGTDFPGASGLYSKYLTIVAGPTITDPALVGFDILNLYRNGIALQYGVEYNFVSSTGVFTFNQDLYSNEWIYVIYG